MSVGAAIIIGLAILGVVIGLVNGVKLETMLELPFLFLVSALAR